MFHSTACATADIPYPFQWARQPAKIALSLWGIWTPLLHCSPGPCVSAPKRHLHWFSPFFRVQERNQQTDTQTDHSKLLFAIFGVRTEKKMRFVEEVNNRQNFN